MRFQNSSVAFALISRRLAKTNRSRHIRGAIEVLGARIDKEKLLFCNWTICLRSGMIVNNRGIRSDCSNRFKAQTDIIILRSKIISIKAIPRRMNSASKTKIKNHIFQTKKLLKYYRLSYFLKFSNAVSAFSSSQ